MSSNCGYLQANRAGEPLDWSDHGKVTNWTEWTEFNCGHPDAMTGDGCPYLDDSEVKCPLKENEIQGRGDMAKKKEAKE